MKKIILLTVFILLIITEKTKSQTIDLIPNLNPSHGGFSTFNFNPTVFNGNLYFFYETYNCKYQLAKFDGNTITLIPNIDTNDRGCYNEMIIYNNNLYFGYIKANNSSKVQLAKYNGDSIALINNLNITDNGFAGSPVIYNNELYFYYQNVKNRTMLAKLNGTNITIIPNFNTSDLGVCGNNIVFNNKLYLGYRKFPIGKYLAEYNGSSYTTFSNPLPDDETNGFAGNIFIFQNNIMFCYSVGIGSLSLIKFNGTSNTLIPYKYRGNHVIFNNNLYYSSPQDYWGSKNRLAKYDGNTVTIYPNLDSNDYGININLIVYNNDIYFPYTKNKGFLGKLNGNTISLIANPDSLSSGVGSDMFVYGNNLYFRYVSSLSQNNLQIGKYNGNSISLLQNPDTLDMGYWGLPVQYGNSMYFQYHVSVTPLDIYQLARFTDSTLSVTESFIGEKTFTLYPNPVNSKLTIDIRNLIDLLNTTVSIYDLQGRLLLEQAVVQSLTEINVSNFTKSIYIVKVKNDNESRVSKFVKE